MTKINFPFTTPALPIKQPFGVFYAVVLPPELLLQVAASDSARAKANLTKDGGYTIAGIQKINKSPRLSEIAQYIERVDATFPNSIILAANHDFESHIIQPDKSPASKQWAVSQSEDGQHTLTIPTGAINATIIDGQHRLFAFAKTNPETRSNMGLLCSVFLDLPKPKQAYILATINSAQRRVDPSLNYELFAYDMDENKAGFWNPVQVAVHITRKLATDKASPLCGKIDLATKQDKPLADIATSGDWQIPMGAIVLCIVKLISSNHARDANLMRHGKIHPRKILEHGRKDESSLRAIYVRGEDAVFYSIVLNYLQACHSTFWHPYEKKKNSVLLKTIGVQALFDILALIAKKAHEDKTTSTADFTTMLKPAGEIDFADTRYHNYSGSGRILIRNAIKKAMGLPIAKTKK